MTASASSRRQTTISIVTAETDWKSSSGAVGSSTTISISVWEIGSDVRRENCSPLPVLTGRVKWTRGAGPLEPVC